MREMLLISEVEEHQLCHNRLHLVGSMTTRTADLLLQVRSVLSAQRVNSLVVRMEAICRCSQAGHGMKKPRVDGIVFNLFLVNIFESLRLLFRQDKCILLQIYLVTLMSTMKFQIFKYIQGLFSFHSSHMQSLTFYYFYWTVAFNLF